MAKYSLNFKGFDEYMKFLDTMGANAENAAKSALGQGARVTADELRKKISGMPVIHDADNLKAYAEKADDKKYRLSVAQKAGLLKGLGIAKFKTGGNDVNTSIGFDGYNDVKTRKYPNGQPNQLVARIYENGTSYSAKMPFVRPAKNASKKKAEAAMVEAFNKYVEAVKRDKGIS